MRSKLLPTVVFKQMTVTGTKAHCWSELAVRITSGRLKRGNELCQTEYASTGQGLRVLLKELTRLWKD